VLFVGAPTFGRESRQMIAHTGTLPPNSFVGAAIVASPTFFQIKHVSNGDKPLFHVKHAISHMAVLLARSRSVKVAIQTTDARKARFTWNESLSVGFLGRELFHVKRSIPRMSRSLG
jgi:hypothetical protein